MRWVRRGCSAMSSIAVLGVAALLPPPAGAHGPLEERLRDLAGRIARAPDDPELYLERGEFHRLRGDGRAAAADFGRAARLDPAHPTLAFYRGRLALEVGDPSSAIELLTAFLDSPGAAGEGDLGPAAHALRARARLELGRIREAVDDFDRAIESLPNAGPELFVERAQALAGAADGAAGGAALDEALAGLERGIETLGPVVALERLVLELGRRGGGPGAPRALRQRPRGRPATAAADLAGVRAKPAAAVPEGGAGTVQVVRGPYLNRVAPDGVVVRWRTDQPAASRVLYGDAPDALLAEVEDPALETEHQVALSGLAPDTLYFYAVADGDGILAGADVDHFFRTAPAAGAVRPIRIWAIGDSGTADANAAAVRDAYLALAAGAATDVWLMLGDNAYTHGTDAQYQAAVFDLYPTLLRNTVLWPAVGNHDALTSDSFTQSGPYFDVFTLPAAAESGGLPTGTEAYYAFDYGNVHFICLDSSDTDRALDGPMMQWLEADAQASTQPWLIAFWHHPPYSRGSHDSDNPIDSQGRMFDMRERALPILEAAGVDLVLTGHSHSYERSVLLDGHYGTSDTLSAGMVLDAGGGDAAGDGSYFKLDRPREGAVYAVAGSSGQRTPGALDHPVMFVSLDRLGSLVIDVDGPRLDARFVAGSGEVLDRFTLVQGLRPELTIDDVSVQEGGGATASFTVAIGAAAPVEVAVDYGTADGTATAGEDYVATAGVLTLPAGATAATFAVEVLGDGLEEGPESFSVVLGNPRNASLADGEGTATLLDDVDTSIFRDGFESGDASAWTPAGG